MVRFSSLNFDEIQILQSIICWPNGFSPFHLTQLLLYSKNKAYQTAAASLAQSLIEPTNLTEPLRWRHPETFKFARYLGILVVIALQKTSLIRGSFK